LAPLIQLLTYSFPLILCREVKELVGVTKNHQSHKMEINVAILGSVHGEYLQHATTISCAAHLPQPFSNSLFYKLSTRHRLVKLRSRSNLLSDPTDGLLTAPASYTPDSSSCVNVFIQILWDKFMVKSKKWTKAMTTAGLISILFHKEYVLSFSPTTKDVKLHKWTNNNELSLLDTEKQVPPACTIRRHSRFTSRGVYVFTCINMSRNEILVTIHHTATWRRSLHTPKMFPELDSHGDAHSAGQRAHCLTEFEDSLCVQRSPALYPIPSQYNPFGTQTQFLYKVHRTVILPHISKGATAGLLLLGLVKKKKSVYTSWVINNIIWTNLITSHTVVSIRHATIRIRLYKAAIIRPLIA